MKRRREWFGPARMSCHISCNPSSLAMKTLDSLRMHDPGCPGNLTDEQASLTPDSTPFPTLLVPMAWLGLFRGKLTMSGISGVTKK